MYRLVFIIIAAILPAASLAMALVGYDYYDRERTRLVRDSLSTTRALAAAVDTEFAVVRATLLALTTSKRLADGDFAGFHAQALQATQEQDSIANVILTDAGGRQLINTFRRFGEPLPATGDPGGMARTFRTGAPVVSDIFKGRVTGSHVIGVGVPVKRGGQIVHGLNAGLLPDRFSGLLKRQQLPEAWVGVVLDTSGTIVARTHDEAHLVGQKASPVLLRRAREANEGAFDAHTVEGTPVLTMFSRAPVSGYTVAMGIPERELIANLISSMVRLFLAGFIALITALGVVFLLASRFLRPDER